MKLQKPKIITTICHNNDSLCSFLKLPQILIFPFPLAIEQTATLAWAEKNEKRFHNNSSNNNNNNNSRKILFFLHFAQGLIHPFMF